MNPLQKYFRQPKIYLQLPSKGLYYADNALQGDAQNMPIFAMTGMDELIMKTPDALFNGEATVKLIESCCPYIKDAHKMPSLDLDALLVAIRIATYGNDMSIGHTCKNCGTENDFSVNLTAVLDHYKSKTFDNRLHIDDLIVNFKPLNYEEMTLVNIENFKLQKMLTQILNIDTEERQQHLDAIYEKLGEIQAGVFISSIESIQTPEATVTDKEFIKEWLSNTHRESYSAIKTKLETNKDSWNMPMYDIVCENCGTEDKVDVVMDQSSFFE
jgi:hypothetical protein